jgi:hypothetical protein
MRLLSQNIAQRANREDKEVGKFWQARYRAVRLLDETAILACAAYVDLNPIRAAMAKTIETSNFTSAQKRAASLAAREGGPRAGAEKGAIHVGSVRKSQACVENSRPEDRSGYGAQHLAPVELNERNGRPGPDANRQGLRCSNKGFLPMSTVEYLSLLDWTARQQRADKPGTTPKQFGRLFERLGISAEAWSELVRNFGRLFSVVAGKPAAGDGQRSRSGSHRYRTRPVARDLLATV